MPATLFHKITESFAGSLYVGHSEANLLYLEQVALRSTTPVHLVDSMVRALDDMRYLLGNTVAAPSHVVRFMGQIGIVSPFFEAVPLRLLQLAAREKKMPFPVRVATKIALDIFDGLCQYHASDAKLYGGICPDHLLVGTDGDTRVGNIPVSAITPKESPWRGKVERLAYLAPEQVTAAYGYDARTDVYAIGLILWEMVANQSRLTGTPLQILESLRAAKEPRSLLPLDESKISKGLLQALSRAMHPNPAERQASIGAFALDLLEAEEEPAAATEVAEFVEQIAQETLQPLRTAVALQQIEVIKQSRSSKLTGSGVKSSTQTVEAEQLLASVGESRPPSMPPNSDSTAVFSVTAELLERARRGVLRPPPKPAPAVPEVPLGNDKTVTFEVPDDLLDEARRLFETTENDPAPLESEHSAKVSSRASQSATTAPPPAAVPITQRPYAPTTDQKQAEELLRKLRSDGPGPVRSGKPTSPKVEDDVTTIWRPERQTGDPQLQTDSEQSRPRAALGHGPSLAAREREAKSGLSPSPGSPNERLARPSVAPKRLGYWLLGLVVSVVVGALTVYASHFLGH